MSAIGADAFGTSKRIEAPKHMRQPAVTPPPAATTTPTASPTSTPSGATLTGHALVLRDGFNDKIWSATQVTIIEFVLGGALGKPGNGTYGYVPSGAEITMIAPGASTVATQKWQERVANLLTSKSTYDFSAATETFSAQVLLRVVHGRDSGGTIDFLFDFKSRAIERRWGGKTERFSIRPGYTEFTALVMSAWQDAQEWESLYPMVYANVLALGESDFVSAYEDQLAGDGGEDWGDDDWDDEGWDDEDDWDE
jgi:hypothetical protein